MLCSFMYLFQTVVPGGGISISPSPSPNHTQDMKTTIPFTDGTTSDNQCESTKIFAKIHNVFAKFIVYMYMELVLLLRTFLVKANSAVQRQNFIRLD